MLISRQSYAGQLPPTLFYLFLTTLFSQTSLAAAITAHFSPPPVSATLPGAPHFQGRPVLYHGCHEPFRKSALAWPSNLKHTSAKKPLKHGPKQASRKLIECRDHYRCSFRPFLSPRTVIIAYFSAPPQLKNIQLQPDLRPAPAAARPSGMDEPPIIPPITPGPPQNTARHPVIRRLSDMHMPYWQYT